MELGSIILHNSTVDKKMVQEVRHPTENTPFVHCAAIAMTPAGASSFLHFLSNLQDMILLANLVTLSLISLSTIPMFPMLVPNCSFTSSMISFSLVLLSKYSYGCVPIIGNLVILVINATSTCTGLSIQRIPPCTWASNCLTQIPTFLPRPKCGMSRRFIILKL
jgi:hypothetical protein